MRCWSACLLTLLAAAGGVWAQTVGAPSLEVLERLAEERYAEGDLTSAAELYLEIAEREQDEGKLAAALFTASWLQHLAGGRPEALESLSRALALRPDHPFDPALYNASFELLYQQAREVALRERQRQSGEALQQALVALETGDDERARQHLERSIELDPDNSTSLYNLALLELRQGRLSQAVTRFERVVALTYAKPEGQMAGLRARAQASIGVAYQQQGLLEDAEEAYQSAIGSDPREATAWRNLGVLALERDDPDNAVVNLEKANQLLPDDPEVVRLLAGVLQQLGRTGQAIVLLEGTLRRHPDDGELWLELAKARRLEGSLTETVAALERAMAADPRNHKGFAAKAATLLAETWLEQDDPEAAVEAASKAVELDPRVAAALVVLGRAQLASDDAPAAIASFTRASELEPDAVAPLLALAEAHTEAIDLSSAEAAYLRAQALDPGSSAASAGLERLRARMTAERDIVSGKSLPRKPVPPKKIGLEFAGLDYKDLALRGALVKNVGKRSPAARAGLRKGDLVLWIGEYAVLSDKDFFQYLKRNPPREILEVRYLRDGQILETEIALR